VQSCNSQRENSFLIDKTPFFDVQKIFDDERLPNVITATDGTIIAVWGWNNVRVRRSEDGGKSWQPEILIGSGLNGGGDLDEKPHLAKYIVDLNYKGTARLGVTKIITSI